MGESYGEEASTQRESGSEEDVEHHHRGPYVRALCLSCCAPQLDVALDRSWVFREPVDPVALGIPTYFDIIPRKDARDLRTIQNKLNQDKYDSIDAFEADLDLMIENAITFNGADSEVGEYAVKLQNKYRELLAPIRGNGGNTKRKGGEMGKPQPAKKVKLS